MSMIILVHFICLMFHVLPLSEFKFHHVLPKIMVRITLAFNSTMHPWSIIFSPTETVLHIANTSGSCVLNSILS